MRNINRFICFFISIFVLLGSSEASAEIKYKKVAPGSKYYCGRVGSLSNLYVRRSPSSKKMTGISFDNALKSLGKKQSAVRQRLAQMNSFRDLLEENDLGNKDLRSLLKLLRNIKDQGFDNVGSEFPKRRQARLKRVSAVIKTLQREIKRLEKEKDGVDACDLDEEEKKFFAGTVATEAAIDVVYNESVSAGVLLTIPFPRNKKGQKVNVKGLTLCLVRPSLKENHHIQPTIFLADYCMVYDSRTKTCLERVDEDYLAYFHSFYTSTGYFETDNVFENAITEMTNKASELYATIRETTIKARIYGNGSINPEDWGNDDCTKGWD